MTQENNLANKNECIFCDLDSSRILDESELFVVIRDAYPVTEGHTLIISKRCAQDWFALTLEEQSSLNQLFVEYKAKLQIEFPEITGFNIGMNCGEAAGQTVMHFHAHLIPRRIGDCEQPRGGVRGVIPERQGY